MRKLPPSIPAIPLTKIRDDEPELQIRCEINEATVLEYAEAMRGGDKFPPVDVYRDGDKYVLTHGFHRFGAAWMNFEQGGANTIAVKIHASRWEAIRNGLSENKSQQGLRYTNADKRRAVVLALREQPNRSSEWYAEVCGVSRPFAEKVRKEVEPVTVTGRPKPRIGRDEKVRKTVRAVAQGPCVELERKNLISNINYHIGKIEEHMKKAASFATSKEPWWNRHDFASALSYLRKARECIENPKWPLNHSRLPPAKRPDKPALVAAA
jgi:hypothetical protein